ESLRGAGIVIAFDSFAEAREDDIPVCGDVIPAIGKTRPEDEMAPLRAAIEAEMDVVARSRRLPFVNIEAGVAVAGKSAQPYAVEEAAVTTDEEAAGRAVEPCRVAVALPLTPGAEALAPNGEAIRVGRGADRAIIRIGCHGSRRCSGTTEGRPQPVE